MKIKTILTMVAVSLFLVGCGEKKKVQRLLHLKITMK